MFGRIYQKTPQGLMPSFPEGCNLPISGLTRHRPACSLSFPCMGVRLACVFQGVAPSQLDSLFITSVHTETRNPSHCYPTTQSVIPSQALFTTVQSSVVWSDATLCFLRRLVAGFLRTVCIHRPEVSKSVPDQLLVSPLFLLDACL